MATTNPSPTTFLTSTPPPPPPPSQTATPPTTATSPAPSATTTAASTAVSPIVAGVIGGVFILLVLIVLGYYFYYHRTFWRRRTPSKPGTYSALDSQNDTPSSRRGSAPQPRSRPISGSLRSMAQRASILNNRMSVRSIISLPPYRSAPNPDEQLIAREGERAGIDTIVDLPEQEEELEARREEEMSTLFQIREARRREVAAREALRAERRAARARHDVERVRDIDVELQNLSSAQTAVSTSTEPDAGIVIADGEPQATSGALIAELRHIRETNARSRRVSSVSYQDIGTARHDGSRVRGGSFESQRPLLNPSVVNLPETRSRRGSNVSEISQVSHGSQPGWVNVRDASASNVSLPLTVVTTTATANGSEHALGPLGGEGAAPTIHPPEYGDDIEPPTPAREYGEAPAYETLSGASTERGRSLTASRSAQGLTLVTRDSVLGVPGVQLHVSTPVD